MASIIIDVSSLYIQLCFTYNDISGRGGDRVAGSLEALSTTIRN